MQVNQEIKGVWYSDLRVPSDGLFAGRMYSVQLMGMARCLPVALLAGVAVAPNLKLLIALLLGGYLWVRLLGLRVVERLCTMLPTAAPEQC